MKRLRTARGALSYANVMATVAVFIALGGVAGAVIQPLLDKKGSVKGRHIARGAVHMRDLAPAVRKQVAGPQIAPPNFGPRQSADGSLTITMLVDWTIFYVSAMGASGDCAFPYQEGHWDDDGTGEGNLVVGRNWNGEGAGTPHVRIEARSSPDGQTAPFFGVTSVIVGTGDDTKTCDTEVSFVPH